MESYFVLKEFDYKKNLSIKTTFRHIKLTKLKEAIMPI